MDIPHAHLVVFVATRAEDVPAGCKRFISVDGSVPGYTLRWDHHVSGERINLEAMPDVFDASEFDGVGTTLADADALASVVAVMLGGKGRIAAEALAILESASYWCDHLRGHPSHADEVNRLGRGLLDAIDARLEGKQREAASVEFAVLATEIAEKVAQGEPLPFLDRFAEHQRRAAAVKSDGKLTELGEIALVDLRDAPEIDPAAVYELHVCPVSVHVDRHEDGGPRYTVGVHPHLHRAPSDIRPALRALARAEHEHGPPALCPSSEPGSENWGGRARVFGSPWNYGSRLSSEEVVRIVAEALGLAAE